MSSVKDLKRNLRSMKLRITRFAQEINKISSGNNDREICGRLEFYLTALVDLGAKFKRILESTFSKLDTSNASDLDEEEEKLRNEEIDVQNIIADATINVIKVKREGTRPMFPPENFPLPKDDDRVISFVGGERGLNIIPSPTPSFGTLPNSSSGRSPPSQRSIVVTPDQLPNSNSKSSKFRQDAKSSRRVPSNSPNNKRGHSSYRSRSTSKDKSRVSRRVANDDQRSSSRSTYYKGRVVSDKQSNADSKNKPHENESARSGGLSKSNRSRVNSCSPERSRHRKPSGSNSSSSRRRRHTESRGRSRSRSRSVGRRSRSIDRRSDNRDKWRKPERHSPEGGRYGRKSRETQGKHRPSRFPNEREQYSYRSANDMEPQPAPMQPIIHMQQEHQQQAAQQPQQPGRTAPMGPSFIPMHRFYTPMIPQVIPTFMPPRYRPPLPRPPPGVYHPF